MQRIAVIGAGITGVTTAYSLLQRGFGVTIFERHRYAAMETSFANGGQLSASNAEVWNRPSTILHGLQWMFRQDAPLLFNPKPSWHKYSWIAEFIAEAKRYRQNTKTTVKLALAARKRLFHIAQQENIEFDIERRGILHLYKTKQEFEAATESNRLLVDAGLDRFPVTPDEMKGIEPALTGTFIGGFYTPGDATGDIHKFTRGLADACVRKGATFRFQAGVDLLEADATGKLNISVRHDGHAEQHLFDGAVVCAGVASRDIARALGDRLNIYPVKGYSITVNLETSREDAAPRVSILDDHKKIVTSRLNNRFRVAGTAEFNGINFDIRADRIAPLVNWTREHFPAIETDWIVPWAGLRPMTPSMLPRVGASSWPNVFYNTGHGHLGWTMAAATSELVSEHIVSQLARNELSFTQKILPTMRRH